MTSNWYTWPSIESFDAWHDQLCELLDLPWPSRDIDGNVVGAPYITAYTNPVVVSQNDVRAVVDDRYASELVPSSPPPPSPQELAAPMFGT
jgi:hypothetical protein